MSSLAQMEHLRQVSAGAIDFVKLAICVARSEREQVPLSAFARMVQSPKLKELLADPRLPMMLKGAPTGTSDLGLTTPDTMSNAFIQSVAPFSIFERALADGAFLTVPLRAFVRILTSDVTGSTVAEADLVPVLKLTAELDRFEPVKVQACIIGNDEIFQLDAPEANTLLGGAMRNAIAKQVDSQFLSMITSGTGSTPSTGLTAAHILTDLNTALGLIDPSGSNARFYWAVPPSIYKGLAVTATTAGDLAFPGFGVNGGQIGNVKVIPSSGASSDGVLFDAGQIGVASAGLEISTTINAALPLDDSPTSGSRVVSLFDSNMTGVRLTRYINAKPLRSTSVCSISGMISA